MREFESTQLAPKKVPRHKYLVTYSQAKLMKLLTGKRFGRCILSNEGIVVNFRNNYDHSYFAYKCIFKENNSIHHSNYRLILDVPASPQTKNSIQVYQKFRILHALENPANALAKKTETDLVRSSKHFSQLYFGKLIYF